MIMDLKYLYLGHATWKITNLMNVKEPDCPMIARNGHIKVLFLDSSTENHRLFGFAPHCPTRSLYTLLYIHILYVTGAC
jgi:hypothetical protein